MEILKLYRAILDSLNVVADEGGLLSFNYAGQIYPAMVGERRLALPTHEVLRAANWNNVIAFHPLSENLLRGESPVLKKLKAVMNLRLTAVLSALMHQLLEICADTSKHSKLSPKAHELLSCCPEADKKSLEAMTDIIDATSPDGPNRLVSIYLKRGGNYKGTKHSRVAVISFPIMEEFEKGGNSIFGVKLRRKDFVGFEKLLNYILPDAGNLEKYSAGSSSLIAPYFDALLKAFEKAASAINIATRTHRKLLDDEELHIALDWTDDIKDLTVYRDMIPPLAGNDGDVEGQEVEPVARKPLPSVIAGDAPTVTSIPSTTAVKIPVQIEEKKGPFNTSFTSASIAPAPIRPMVGMDAGVVDAAGVKHTKNGVDFNSLMEARARAAHQPMMGHAQYPGMPMNPAMMHPAALPAWAAPTGPAAPPPNVGGYNGYHRGIPVAPSYGYPPQQMYGVQPQQYGMGGFHNPGGV